MDFKKMLVMLASAAPLAFAEAYAPTYPLSSLGDIFGDLIATFLVAIMGYADLIVVVAVISFAVTGLAGLVVTGMAVVRHVGGGRR